MKESNSLRPLLLSIKKWLQRYKYNMFNMLYIGVIAVILIIALILTVTSERSHKKSKEEITTTNKEELIEEEEENNQQEQRSFAEMTTVTDTEDEVISDVSIENKKEEQSETIIEETVNSESIEEVLEVSVEESISESGVNTSEYYLDIPLSNELQDYIYNLANENNIPFELIIALINVESNFNSTAISATNDYGLCQINISNHGWLSRTYGVTDFLDPYQNVLCAVKMLNSYGITCNNTYEISKLLMCYNMGAGAANSYWNQGIYSTYYTVEVINMYNYYCSL